MTSNGNLEIPEHWDRSCEYVWKSECWVGGGCVEKACGRGWGLILRAVVDPILMHGCESWTIKLNTEELMHLNCGAGEDS